MDKPVRKIDSFKKLPKVAAPVKASINEDTFMPGMMKPGTVLTEIEKEGLRQLGIVDDPSALPSDIAKRISEVVSNNAKQPELVAPSTPLKMPKIVDFKDLSQERKKEIADSIREALVSSKLEKEQNEASVSDGPPLNPDIFKVPEVIDDLLEKAQADSNEDNTDGSKKFVDSSGALSLGEALTCAHCGWDTRKQELTEATSEDKADFVQSILGGIRFKKVYSVFGDQLRITFRTLTSAESDMAYKQLVVDCNNDIQTKILGDTSFYWRTLMAYRCILSVEKLESNEGITEIPAISEISVDEGSYSKPNTKLSAIFDEMVAQVMPTEIVRTTITHLYTEFQSLCEKLQAMAESKDFWKATK